MSHGTEVFEKAIQQWMEYVEKHPGPAWVLDYLRFLAKLAHRAEDGDRKLTGEEKKRLQEISPGGLGPLGGFAVHDMADVETGNMLSKAQHEADRLKRRLRWRLF